MKSWLVIPTGGGGIGLFGGGVGAELTGHTNTVIMLGTYAGAVLLAVTAAIVAIVRIRTNRSTDSRRMATLTRLARKHDDPDLAMRLLMLEKYLGKTQGLSSDQVMKLLGGGLTPNESHSEVPDVKELVNRADAGQDVVPPHPPEADGRPDSLSGL